MRAARGMANLPSWSPTHTSRAIIVDAGMIDCQTSERQECLIAIDRASNCRCGKHVQVTNLQAIMVGHIVRDVSSANVLCMEGADQYSPID